MSLAYTAEYLKLHGRGPDDQLVHMSSKELHGLQKLAKASGGSLTTNPHTGLPEAGFLDSILPTVIGVGLDIATGGALTPLEIGLGVGGLNTLMTGNLGQGLMAGLGAYGGAGLSGALGSMGATAANAATSAAAQGTATAAGEEAVAQATSQGITNQASLDAIRQQAIEEAGNASGTAAAPTSTSSISQGIKQLGQPGGLSSLSDTLTSQTPYAKAGLLSAGLGALSPNAFGATTVPGSNQQSNPMNLSTISPNFKGYVPPQPNPYYKAQYTDYTQNPYMPRTMAEGGLAMGGMPNQMYPQSQQEHTIFADPKQLPTSAMAVRNFEPATNPMTGDTTQAMAAGGKVKHFDGGGGVQGGGQMHLDVPISVGGGGGGGGDQGGFAGYGGGQSGDGGGPGYMQSPAQSLGGKGGMALQQQMQQPLQQQMQQQPAQGFGNKGGSGMSVESQFPGQMGGAGNVYAQPFMQMQQMLQGLGQGQGNAYAQQPGFIGNPIGPNINMAEGGKVPGYSAGHLARTPSMPDTGEFYDTNISTRNLPADKASVALLKQRAKQAGIALADLPKTSIQQLGGDFSDTGAHGGIATLGSYSDGGRLLKGPGDGMSDDIPAQIGKHQPARLADGEFVVPADVVSHLGNGSTDAGAKKLYSMMDKIRKARTGKKAQGKQINADKFLPK
jgi:hypothetical protein